MNRRNFLRAVSIVAASALVGACGASQNPIALAKDKPTFVYFYAPG